jgi:hypothetical protein
MPSEFGLERNSYFTKNPSLQPLLIALAKYALAEYCDVDPEMCKIGNFKKTGGHPIKPIDYVKCLGTVMLPPPLQYTISFNIGFEGSNPLVEVKKISPGFD